MRKLFISMLLLFTFILFNSALVAQEDNNFHVIHIQTWKLKSIPTGDDAAAFSDLLKRQSGVINADMRVLRSYVLRHFWGGDSRDLVMVSEFKSSEEMFAFYEAMN